MFSSFSFFRTTKNDECDIYLFSHWKIYVEKGKKKQISHVFLNVIFTTHGWRKEVAQDDDDEGF